MTNATHWAMSVLRGVSPAGQSNVQVMEVHQSNGSAQWLTILRVRGDTSFPDFYLS
jgi:hypothetical protein